MTKLQEELKQAREATNYWADLAKRRVDVEKTGAETEKTRAEAKRVDTETSVVLPQGMKNQRAEVRKNMIMAVVALFTALGGASALSHVKCSPDAAVGHALDRDAGAK